MFMNGIYEKLSTGPFASAFNHKCPPMCSLTSTLIKVCIYMIIHFS